MALETIIMVSRRINPRFRSGFFRFSFLGKVEMQRIQSVSFWQIGLTNPYMNKWAEELKLQWIQGLYGYFVQDYGKVESSIRKADHIDGNNICRYKNAVYL